MCVLVRNSNSNVSMCSKFLHGILPETEVVASITLLTSKLATRHAMLFLLVLDDFMMSLYVVLVVDYRSVVWVWAWSTRSLLRMAAMSDFFFFFFSDGDGRPKETFHAPAKLFLRLDSNSDIFHI